MVGKFFTRLMVAAALTGVVSTGTAWVAMHEISGAGATFPYPVYAKWAGTYAELTGIKLNYQAIGSGGGIKQISAKTVDFGASDAPLKPEMLDKIGLLAVPDRHGWCGSSGEPAGH